MNDPAVCADIRLVQLRTEMRLLLHTPVLRFDLLRVLKHPIDGGRSWRGQRLFGDNKTWRGALVMTLGCVLATILLSHIGPY